MEGLWSVLPIVLEILLPVIGVVLTWLLTLLVKKLKLQNNINVDMIIEHVVGRAVEAVEQLAAVAKKKGDAALSSGDKLAKAVAIVEAELRAMKLPGLAAEVISARVEAYLGFKASFEEDE